MQHGGFVLLEGAREPVAAVAPRYEVEVIRLGGLGGGAHGGLAGVGDGPRRQPRELVGVVGIRLILQMPAPQIAVEIGNAVDYGGIGFELFADGQPVVEDGGDYRPLPCHAGFFFDDGGEGHQIVHTQAALFGQRRDALPDAVKLLHHDARDDLGRQAAGEPVGFGEQVALQSVGGHAEAAGKLCVIDQRQKLPGVGEAGRFQVRGNFHRRPAFGKRHRRGAHPPADQPLHHRPRAQRGRQLVVTGAQVVFPAPPARPPNQRPLVAHQARLLERARHRTQGGAARHLEDHGSLVRRDGVQRHAQPQQGGKPQHQENPQPRQGEAQRAQQRRPVHCGSAACRAR